MSISLVSTFEMSVKGVRVRYAKFMTLLSIFKGTVNMNKKKNAKWEKFLWHVKWNFYLSTFLHFEFSEICRIVDKVNKSKIY